MIFCINMNELNYVGKANVGYCRDSEKKRMDGSF